MDEEQFICTNIILALKHGVVPACGLERIVVGREGELTQLRHDLEFSKSGGAWVRLVLGDYGAGKTFLCSLAREVAWREGFVVAAIGMGRDAPWHKSEAIYRRIIDGMRTDHVRNAPAFEFIVQEWLFHLEQEVRRTGLDPSNAEHRDETASIIGQQIDAQLLALHIHSNSLANALCAYYVASQRHQEHMATEAVRWLKGEPDVAPELRKQFDITDVIDKDNAFDFLRAMAKLIAHIGYAGLIVLCDETELIRSISRPESRDAAYENIRLLMDKAAQGEFTHCGFMFTGTRDLLDDAHRGIASYPVLHERWRPKRAMRRTKDGQQPVILLEGFDRRKLHEVARKVRDVHGIAHDWDPSAHLTDELLARLLESMAARVADKLTTAPRGFLKVLVDMLDELEQNRHRSAAEAIALGINTDRIEDIEREEARLLDHA